MTLAWVTEVEWKMVDRGLGTGVQGAHGQANRDTWKVFYGVKFQDGLVEQVEESWCQASEPPATGAW